MAYKQLIPGIREDYGIRWTRLKEHLRGLLGSAPRDYRPAMDEFLEKALETYKVHFEIADKKIREWLAYPAGRATITESCDGIEINDSDRDKEGKLHTSINISKEMDNSLFNDYGIQRTAAAQRYLKLAASVMSNEGMVLEKVQKNERTPPKKKVSTVVLDDDSKKALELLKRYGVNISQTLREVLGKLESELKAADETLLGWLGGRYELFEKVPYLRQIIPQPPKKIPSIREQLSRIEEILVQRYGGNGENVSSKIERIKNIFGRASCYDGLAAKLASEAPELIKEHGPGIYCTIAEAEIEKAEKLYL